MEDLSDDTTVFSMLKSFKSSMARPERSQSQPTTYGSGSDLGKLYTHKMEMEESAKRIHSHTSLLQLSQEKQQMELSHKRARIELETIAHSSSRDLQREVDKNQDLQMRIRRLEEKEAETGRSLTEQVESNKQLKLKIDKLQHLEERDHSLTQANQTVSFLKNELRELLQQLHNQRSNRVMQVVLEKLQGWERHLEVRHAQLNSPLQLTAAEESLDWSEFVAPNLLVSGIKEENAVPGYEECSRFEGADHRAEQSSSSKAKLTQTSLVSSEGLVAPATDDDDYEDDGDTVVFDDDDDEDYEDDGDTDDDDDDEEYTDYSRAVKTRKRGKSRIDQTRTSSGAVQAYLLQDPAMDSAAPPPVRKRRPITSIVWHHFTVSSADPTKAICKLCKAIIGRGRDKRKLSTTPMHNHLQCKHSTLSKTPPSQGHSPPHPACDQTPLHNVVHDTQLPITTMCNSNTFYPDDHPTAKQITAALGEMICQDPLPVSAVEHKALLRLLAVIAPQYRVPSLMHFSRTVEPNLNSS